MIQHEPFHILLEFLNTKPTRQTSGKVHTIS
jgi:hypothetical protein